MTQSVVQVWATCLASQLHWQKRMSRHINVNPAHYKVRGRERQGEDILHEVHRQAFAQQADADRWHESQQAPPPPHPPEQAAAEEAQLRPARRRRSKARKETRRKSAGRATGASRTTAARKRGARPASRKGPAGKKRRRGSTAV